ncbi:MAG: hypothetical protein JNN30_05375 [Rhodanobacteraceae bacterium]|nr:hypothetical protein [Rhodanobacteraceae bacterium]
MKFWILLAVLLPAAQTQQTQQTQQTLQATKPDCIERRTTTRLATLEIRTCLYGYAATAQAPARAVEVRQTLTNVSTKPIVLLLSEDPLRRFAPFILAGNESRDLHKVPRFPTSEDNTFVEPANEYLRLKPRASTELSYRLVDMMIEPPRVTVLYFISARTDFDFRRDGERLTDRDVMRARFDEEAAGDGRIMRARFSGFGISAD